MIVSARPAEHPAGSGGPRPVSATGVVWGTWGVLTAAGLAFVAALGRDCPYMDEWVMLPALAGDVSPVWWAWQPQVEHRWFVPRLGFVGLYRLRAEARRRAAILAAGAIAAGVGMAVVLMAHPGSPYSDMPRTGAGLIGFFVRLAAMAFGPGAEPLWPAFAGALAILATFAVGQLVRLWRSGERLAAGGLVAALAGAAVLALGLTWGRGWAGPPAAVTSRYAVLMAAGVAALFLVCVRTGGRRLAAVGPAVLAGLAAATWPLNCADGLGHGTRLSRQMDALAA